MAVPLLFFAALSPAAAAFTGDFVYRNIFKLDAEYELDRFMGDHPWEWRDRFASSPTGFQTAVGSLNIRHFFVDQRLKVRFPLMDEKFWFRFRHDRRLVFEREDSDTQLEFEVSPVRRWYLSFLGEPTFHKSRTTAGFAARWGPEEGRSLKFSYLWPGFDANYSFRNKSINEGFEEFYNRLPHEARFDAYWIRAPVSFRFESRYRRPSELDHRDLLTPANRFRINEDFHDAVLDFRIRLGKWTWGLEGERWRDREAVAYEPAVPASDRRLVHERSLVRTSLERPLTPAWTARLGGGAVGSRAHLRFPDQTASNESYQMYDRPWFLLLYYAATPRFSVDGGYVYDRQWIRSLEPGGIRVEERRSQNRGRFAVQHDFGNGASIRAGGSVELDANQSERFGSFDGGTVQFQATF